VQEPRLEFVEGADVQALPIGPRDVPGRRRDGKGLELLAQFERVEHQLQVALFRPHRVQGIAHVGALREPGQRERHGRSGEHQRRPPDRVSQAAGPDRS
jgi:hypothetical protein